MNPQMVFAHMRSECRSVSGLLATLLLCLAGAGNTASAQTVRQDFCVTDGIVRATAISGGTLYVGGDFTRAGRVIPSSGGAAVDVVAGAPITAFPPITGTVTCVAPDGSGGWYIGGYFTSVGDVPRAGLAHVLSDYSVSAWNPGANNAVLAMAVSGSTIYVGGIFTIIGGESRNHLAALDAGTGAANSWDPNADGNVRVLALGGTSVYAAGEFSHIGGQPRGGLAAIDATTGSVASWAPEPNEVGRVAALAADANTVYVGGSFWTIGGASRPSLAAVDATTGQTTSWDPQVNGRIRALALTGTTLYAGGDFTTAGLAARNHLAALDTGSGAATSWDPNADDNVTALALTGNSVYAGGWFNHIGGQARCSIAALDVTTGLATSWEPGADKYVSAISVNGSACFLCGVTGLAWRVRSHLAAVDAVTGALTDWNPDADNSVLTLAVDGGTVYAGGAFTAIGGQSRSRIAALDAVTGMATAWDPAADSTVAALAVGGSTVYMGGDFIQVGALARNHIAAVDAASGAVSPWDPDADASVLALTLSGTTLYAGGWFGAIGGQMRNHIAALDLGNGQATNWDPNAQGAYYVNCFWDWYFCASGCCSDVFTGDVRALAVDGTTVYAGGSFNAIGGQNRNRLAALDASTGLATAWDPNGGICIESIGCSPYECCGAKSAHGQLDGVSRVIPMQDRIGTMIRAAQVLRPQPGCDPEGTSHWDYWSCPHVNALAMGASIFSGGDFTVMGGQPGGLTAVDPSTGLGIAWSPLTQPTVYSLTLSGSTLYAGGDFRWPGSYAPVNLAAIDASLVGVGPRAASATLQLRCEPNLFSSTTHIRYSIKSRAPVWLEIYDLAGRKVTTLLAGNAEEPGPHVVEFVAGQLPSGMYVCKLRTAGESRTATLFRRR